MMPDDVKFVIGVDTHRDQHTVAVCDRVGSVVETVVVEASVVGYRRALRAAKRYAPGARIWAVEGTGSYGRGLYAFLAGRGERVWEIDRPSRRRDARSQAKDDVLDAVRAAHEALSRPHTGTPRAGGVRDQLRALHITRQAAIRVRRDGINQLRALVLTAPDEIRVALAGRSATELIARCRRLRAAGRDRHLRIAMRATADRIAAATLEAKLLEREIGELVAQLAPDALREPGVGPISAAQILISYSHRGRLRSEAAFASLAGTNPIPASSGTITRHRLNRGGDRQLNSALWLIVRSRQQRDPATIAYTQRRRAEGKTDREIRRCLMRYLARHIWRLLADATDTGQAAPT
jgi:transposase